MTTDDTAQFLPKGSESAQATRYAQTAFGQVEGTQTVTVLVKRADGRALAGADRAEIRSLTAAMPRLAHDARVAPLGLLEVGVDELGLDRLDVGERLVELDGVALGDAPGDDLALGESLAEVGKTREVIESLADDPEPHYGVSTGFGAMATRYIPAELRSEIDGMARDAAAWLDEHKLLCRTVTIKVRYSDFTTASKTAFQDPGVRFVNINVAGFDTMEFGMTMPRKQALAGRGWEATRTFFSASVRAAVLLPSAAIASAGGPTNTSPASRTARANHSLSERNPYPG